MLVKACCSECGEITHRGETWFGGDGVIIVDISVVCGSPQPINRQHLHGINISWVGVGEHDPKWVYKESLGDGGKERLRNALSSVL